MYTNFTVDLMAIFQHFRCILFIVKPNQSEFSLEQYHQHFRGLILGLNTLNIVDLCLID